MRQKQRTQISWVVPKRAQTPHFLGNDSKWQRSKSHDGVAKKFTGEFSSEFTAGISDNISRATPSHGLMIREEELRDDKKLDVTHMGGHFDYYRDCVEECDRDDVEALLENYDDAQNLISPTLLLGDQAGNTDYQEPVVGTTDNDFSVAQERAVSQTQESHPEVTESWPDAHEFCSNLGSMFQGLMSSETTGTKSPMAVMEDSSRAFWGHFVNESQVCEHCKQPFAFLETKVEDFAYVDACKIKCYFHSNCQATRSAMKSDRKELLWQIVRLGALREQKLLKTGGRRTHKSKARKASPASPPISNVQEPHGSSSLGGSLFKNLLPKKKKDFSLTTTTTPRNASPIRRGRKPDDKARSRSPKKRSTNRESQSFATRESLSHTTRTRSYGEVMMGSEVHTRPERHVRTERNKMLGRFTPISLLERENGLYAGAIKRKSSTKGSLAEETSRYHQLRAHAKSSAAGW